MLFPFSEVKSCVAYYGGWSPGLRMHYRDAEQVVTNQMQGDRAQLARLEYQTLSNTAEREAEVVWY